MTRGVCRSVLFEQDDAALDDEEPPMSHIIDLNSPRNHNHRQGPGRGLPGSVPTHEAHIEPPDPIKQSDEGQDATRGSSKILHGQLVFNLPLGKVLSVGLSPDDSSSNLLCASSTTSTLSFRAVGRHDGASAAQRQDGKAEDISTGKGNFSIKKTRIRRGMALTKEEGAGTASEGDGYPVSAPFLLSFMSSSLPCDNRSVTRHRDTGSMKHWEEHTAHAQMGVIHANQRLFPQSQTRIRVCMFYPCNFPPPPLDSPPQAVGMRSLTMSRYLLVTVSAKKSE